MRPRRRLKLLTFCPALTAGLSWATVQMKYEKDTSIVPASSMKTHDGTPMPPWPAETRTVMAPSVSLLPVRCDSWPLYLRLRRLVLRQEGACALERVLGPLFARASAVAGVVVV